MNLKIKILLLKNINKKLRANNDLENFNSRFKIIYQIKNEINKRQKKC